tara:strand:+ start:1146 stop:2186 length:1041 start_codon:yes stop_codon:yes gene_type:complete
MKTNYESYVSKRKKPVNYSHENSKMYEHELIKNIDKPYYFIKNNLYINSLVIKRFKFFRAFTTHWRMNPLSIKNKLLRLAGDIKNLITNLKNNNKTIYIENASWITDERSNQFFHWLTDSLQRIEILGEEINNYPVIIHENYLNDSFIKDSLDILEVPYIVLDPNKYYKIKNLLITSHVGTPGNYHKEVINRISKKIIDSKNLNFPNNKIKNKKIWISRQNANKRKIINFKEIKKLLEKYGYEILEFEKLSFKDQIITSNTAKIIGGLHGAGLTNMLFMESDSLVFEIRDKKDYKNNCFFSLASDLNHKYFYILGEAVDKNNFYGSNYNIDIKELEKGLENLEKLV